MVSMLAAENIALLRQGCELIEGLNDRQFCYEDEIAQSSIGKHLRHVLDFYRALFEALPEAKRDPTQIPHFLVPKIDYDQRLRDPSLETGRALWLASNQNIQAQLAGLQEDMADMPVEVLSREGVNGYQSRVNSWLGRELQFLLAHTVHHYALVSIALRLQKLRVPEGFGVSYSTRLFWRDSAPKLLPDGSLCVHS